MRTRPDGDLELFWNRKCAATDLKIAVLHTASDGVLDLVAVICLVSQMRRPMQFSPWFDTCIDFHVPEYHRFITSISLSGVGSCASGLPYRSPLILSCSLADFFPLGNAGNVGRNPWKCQPC